MVNPLVVLGYLAAGLLVAVVVMLSWRVLRTFLRPSEGRWRERSGGDRRRRRVPVKVERRRVVRREEDQARTFVRSLERELGEDRA